MATPRDRTAEFQAIIAHRLCKKRTHPHHHDAATVDADLAVGPPPSGSMHTDFNRKASKISIAIHDTSQRVARLQQLAKKSSMFNDPAMEIQELTAFIKQDLSELNSAITELQSVHDSENISFSKQSNEHFKTILDSLKSRLMQTTKEFKEVLTIRTESLKGHQNRKQLFSVSASRDRSSPLLQQVGSSSSNSNNNSKPAPWMHGGEHAYGLSTGGTQLRKRVTGDSSSAFQMQEQMQQEVSMQEHQYTSSTALRNVESTITELSGMFTQLATMVVQQSELAIRIDDNMDDTLANVEGAQGALLKYLHGISSNRGLILKIFFVLILFLIVFVAFIA